MEIIILSIIDVIFFVFSFIFSLEYLPSPLVQLSIYVFFMALFFDSFLYIDKECKKCYIFLQIIKVILTYTCPAFFLVNGISNFLLLQSVFPKKYKKIIFTPVLIVSISSYFIIIPELRLLIWQSFLIGMKTGSH